MKIKYSQFIQSRQEVLFKLTVCRCLVLIWNVFEFNFVILFWGKFHQSICWNYVIKINIINDKNTLLFGITYASSITQNRTRVSPVSFLVTNNFICWILRFVFISTWYFVLLRQVSKIGKKDVSVKKEKKYSPMLKKKSVIVGVPWYNGVFLKWSRTFAEFSEFRETDKSLKHELGWI